MRNNAGQRSLPGHWCGVAWDYTWGLIVVYSSTSDVKSFRVCFCYGIVLTEFIPGPPLPLDMVSIRSIFVSTVLTV